MNIEGKISILENNQEYEVIDTLEYNNKKYILFSNIKNIEDICVRKIIHKDNDEYFSLLNETEFHDVMQKFIQKNKNLFE